MIYDFNKSLLMGRAGEAVVAYTLMRAGYRVTDVRDVAQYQDIDTDLLGVRNGQETTFEIKTDSYTANTGNIYFETVSNVEMNVPGCMLKTTADVLLYYPEGLDYMLWIDMPTYREYIMSRQDKYREHTVPNYRRYHNGISTSVGLIIPASEIEAFDWCHREPLAFPVK